MGKTIGVNTQRFMIRDNEALYMAIKKIYAPNLFSFSAFASISAITSFE